MKLAAGSAGRAIALTLVVAASSGCAETELGVHMLKSAARTIDAASASASDDATSDPPAEAVAAQTLAPERFSAVGTTVWDGAATPEGLWIAHPEAESSERVRVRNIGSGAEIDAAMFRRDAAMIGPTVIVSSDAAVALGLTAGEAAQLDIVALRETTETQASESAASGADGAIEGAIETGALPAPAIADAEPVTAPLPAAAPEPSALAPPTEPGAVVAPTPRPARLAAATSAPAAQPDATYLQAGAFDVEANAAALVERLIARDQAARYAVREHGGRRMSVVLIGPLADAEAIAAARAAAAAEGIDDPIEVTP